MKIHLDGPADQQARAPNGCTEILGTDGSAAWVWGQTLLDTETPAEFKPPASAWKTVYALHIGHMNGNGSGAWPSAARIATELGVSERTVRNDLAALRDRGLVRLVPRFKRESMGHEWQPSLPDDSRVREIAARWRTRADEAASGAGKAIRQRGAGTGDRRSGNRLPDDPAMSDRRSGNELPGDPAMGCRLEDQGELPAKKTKLEQRAAPGIFPGESAGMGTEPERPELTHSRPVPGFRAATSNLAEAMEIEDPVQQLAEISRHVRPAAPCSEKAIRTHVLPLIEKHGFPTVQKVWGGRFLENFQTAGPRVFAERFDQLVGEGVNQQGGPFGRLHGIITPVGPQVRARLRVVG